MPDIAEPPIAESQPRTLLALWPLFLIFCVLACYWSVAIHQLGAQWSIYEQYRYGWAVPILCVYLVWRRIEQSGTSAGESAAADSGTRLRGSALVPAICALAFAPTRLLHEANPIWRLTSLLLALEVIVLTLWFIYVIGGLPALRRFTFPISFFLVAIPWPSGLENFLVQSLTRWNVAATVELLGLFGVPAIQHGNVIEIGTGMVGIDDACSGIRSLQATFMISLFLGEYYFLTVRRRALCVFAGVVCSYLFNVSRTSFLTWIGARKGTTAIPDWHDPAGVTILVACFLTLWLLARFLAQNQGHLTADIHPPAGLSASNLFSPILVACILGGWLAAVEVGTELWFRSHEKRSEATNGWDLNSGATGPSFTEVEIPSDISGQFKADRSAHRVWRDADGNGWQLFYFRWLPGDSLENRVAVQLAKTHGPEKCLPAIGMTLKSDLGIITVPAGQMTLALHQYLFTSEGRPLHVFYGLYEDATGSAVLANRRKDTAKRIAAALAGSRNYGQRFLEIAISGPDRPSDAKAVLTRSIPTLITVEK